jgi:hypothetical protein
MEPLLRVKAKENQSTSTGGNLPQLKQKTAKAEPIQTRLELAKAAHVSHDTPPALHDSICGVFG